MAQPLIPLMADRIAAFPRGGASSVAHGVRDGLIDWAGCTILGARQPVSERARQGRDPAAGDVPVLGTGRTTARALAAFLNAVAAHALDFDDWEVPGNAHVSAVLIPAILSAGWDRGLTFAAFADAYACGFEVVARLGEAMNYDHYARGFHSTATLPVIGGAAAAAKAMGLDAPGIANAMALALSRAIGLTAQFGSDAKPMQAGFAAEGAAVCATLAAAGATGEAAALDGPKGWARLTSDTDDARLSEAAKRFDPPKALAEYGLVFKPYPCCGYTHRAIDAARKLYGRFDPAAIETIEIALPDFHAAILPYGHPRTQAEAMFSLPYCVATALLTGDVTFADMAEAACRRPDRAALIDRTAVHPFRPMDTRSNYHPDQPDVVTVRLTNGTALEERVHLPLGTPENPLPPARLHAKFLANIDGAQAMLDRLLDAGPQDRLSDILTTRGDP